MAMSVSQIAQELSPEELTDLSAKVMDQFNGKAFDIIRVARAPSAKKFEVLIETEDKQREWIKL